MIEPWEGPGAGGPRDAEAAAPGGPELLVAAGEASGDRAAAAVIRALHGRGLALRVRGLGGPALREAGATLLADLRDTTALGIGAVALKTPRLARAHAALIRAARRPNARAALLVNYTEFNLLLAPRLRSLGLRVLWYGAPQVWAWRPWRTHAVRGGVDRMAVVLPFEESLWRQAGVDATYVGHPACEIDALPRAEARALLGLTARAVTVAILPGSRPHEVARLLPRMLAAFQRVRHDRASVDGRVLMASSLDPVTRAEAVAHARRAHLGVYDVDAALGAARVLPAFDAALCASGTAALECVLARAVPVVAYRVGLMTELVARALVRSEHFALPNILLRRRVFAELLQRDVTPAALARELRSAIDRRRELCQACDEVQDRLGRDHHAAREVAGMLAPWLLEPSLGLPGPAHLEARDLVGMP